MGYNIFRLPLFVLMYLTFSADFVQHDRFTRERRSCRESYLAETSNNFQSIKTDGSQQESGGRLRGRLRAGVKCRESVRVWKSSTVSNHGDPKLGAQSSKRTRKKVQLARNSNETSKNWETFIPFAGVVRDLSQLLNFNQVGFLYLAITISHIVFLVFESIKSMLFTFLSLDLDSVTGEYKNPTARLLESYYLQDIMRPVKNAGLYNLVLSMILIHHLTLRVRTFNLRLRSSKVNRYQYRKLDLLSLEISYLNTLSSDTRGWFRSMIQAFKHRSVCNHRLIVGERSNALKKLTKKLQSCSKLDRIYYFNQIEYYGCFTELDIVSKSSYIEEIEPSASEEIVHIGNDISTPTTARGRRAAAQNSVNEFMKLTGSFMRKTRSLLKYMLTLELPGRKSFVSLPTHRTEPFVISVLFLCFAAAMMTMITLLSMIIIAATNYIAIFDMRRHKVPTIDDNEEYTWFQKAHYLFTEPKTLSSAIESAIVYIMVNINMIENGALSVSVIFCRVRAEKVITMLKELTEFKREQTRRFYEYLKTNIPEANELLKSDQNEIAIIRVETNEPSEANLDRLLDSHASSNCNTILKDPLSTRVLFEELAKKAAATVEIFSSEMIKSLRRADQQHTEGENGPNLFMKAVEDFKRTHLRREQVREFNENLLYLTNLIETLQAEFLDMKMKFTLFLNLNLLFCTAVTAICVALYPELRSTDLNLYVIIPATATATIPLSFALFLGALIETSVSNICLF